MAYSIGQVSELLGIPVSTIRYYENKGVLEKVSRTAGGVREFDDVDIGWLRMIAYLKMAGMTVSEISEFTSLYKKGDSSIEERRQLLHRRRNLIMEQMAELQEALDFITYKCWYYDTAAEAGTCSVPRDMPEDEMPPEMAAIKRKCHV